MFHLHLCFILLIFFVECVLGYSQFCRNKTENTLSCTKEIIKYQDHVDYSLCRVEVYPPNSPECGTMPFGPLASNAGIGGVTLRPYIITDVVNEHAKPLTLNRTVLNITFSNIKWTTMKFRFQDKYRNTKNHCRNIVISKDLEIDDHSVLFYDCYWPRAEDNDVQSHILDFEAANEWIVYRGQYYFNVPSAEMLSQTVTENEWKPFVYIEILPTKMRLHVIPPPSHLKIRGYRIKVVKECGKEPCDVTTDVIDSKDRIEVKYDYNFNGESGLFYFVVTPLHMDGASSRNVESPKIQINSGPQSLNICIASVTALIVTSLFAYYIALRVIRRYWCKDYKLTLNDIPTPPKVLVIYSPTNRLHAECVSSFINYLRTEYGFDIMYDGDISTTSHGDPYIWAQEAFRISTHVINIVGPTEQANLYNNIYDKPIISPHKHVDVLLLSFVKADRVSKCPKEIINVLFEHSNAQIPIETRFDKAYVLLNDWHKLISHLSKNMLPKRQIMRTEKGRDFIDNLVRAKELLSVKADVLIERHEKNAFEKKILL